MRVRVRVRVGFGFRVRVRLRLRVRVRVRLRVRVRVRDKVRIGVWDRGVLPEAFPTSRSLVQNLRTQKNNWYEFYIRKKILR